MDLNKNQLNMKKLILVISYLLSTFVTSAQITKLLDQGGTIYGHGPAGTLISDGTFLYGMTNYGGAYAVGTVFKVRPDGTGYATLLDFDGITSGGNPQGALFYDGTFLYGMTNSGGATGWYGTIFKIKPDGTAYATLLNFNDSTGGTPYGSLISDGTYLYGMTQSGGAAEWGTIFKIKRDGTDFTKLFDFNPTDGGSPYGSLISDGTFLYGMTAYGGANNTGVIFKIQPDGTGFSRLFDFNDTTSGHPLGDLIFDGAFLYGTNKWNAVGAGSNLFKIKPDGTNYARVYNFDPTYDGIACGSLISDGTFLYGMTSGDEFGNFGIIYKIKPDGTVHTRLASFSDTTGKYPTGSLVSDGTFLYGMTSIPYGAIMKIKPDGTTFSKVFDFEESAKGVGGSGDLIRSGDFLYGSSIGCGSAGGLIYKIKPDGTEYTKIYEFKDPINGVLAGSVIFDGTYFYGMTSTGGTSIYDGTVYKVKADGTGFTKLLDLNSATTGSNPNGALFYDGIFLYGMTYNGGTGGYGTIFKIKPDGTEFSKLFDFTSSSGTNPSGTLISDGTFLYGLTAWGGTSYSGTIFKIKPDGTEFSKLRDLDLVTGTYPPGALISGSLVSDGTFLYGMTYAGGVNGGTIFKIKPDGTEYAKLLDFDSTATGDFPSGSLLSEGEFLYGMAYSGGLYNRGTIFKIKSDGTAFSKLYDFDAMVNGGNPYGSVISDGSFLYGINNSGGLNNNGVIFKMAISCIANYTTDYDSTLNTFILNVDSAATAIATSYHWDFGDGSTSTLATPSHVYTVDSLYNVCMKIVYADGDSCTYCHTIGIDSAGNIIRDGGFSLVVHNATTGVSENSTNEIIVNVYPNPTTGVFQLAVGNGQLTSTAILSIYNVVGEKIYVKDGKQLNASTTIDLSDQPNGIYFMQLKTETNTVTKKIIINK